MLSAFPLSVLQEENAPQRGQWCIPLSSVCVLLLKENYRESYSVLCGEKV